EKHEALYQFSFRMPKLQTINQQIKKWMSEPEKAAQLENHFTVLRNEVEETNRRFSLKFGAVEEINSGDYTPLTADLLDAWLKEIERQYRVIWEKADDRLRNTGNNLIERLGAEENIESLKEAHHNQKLEEHLLNKHELQKIRVVEDVLIRKSDYIYKEP